jgi:hypothetical protein
MADNAMSWYLVRDGAMKLILYGTGKEHPPQLFNITADSGEVNDLGEQPASVHMHAPSVSMAHFTASWDCCAMVLRSR